jgi:hypothetical protein
MKTGHFYLCKNRTFLNVLYTPLIQFLTINDISDRLTLHHGEIDI